MKKIINVKILFVILFCVTGSAFAETTQYGPFASVEYSHFGIGQTYVPFNEDPLGTVQGESGGFPFTSFRNYKIAVGGFYDVFYTQFYYSGNNAYDQSTTTTAYDLSNTVYGGRLGYRLSDPGYSSYMVFFAGVKRSVFESDYLGLDVSGLGYDIGFRHFITRGLKYDWEFVFDYEIFAGNYRITDFSSNVEMSGQKRLNSVTAGGSLGAGVMYEPYNIALLLKVSPEAELITHRITTEGTGIRYGVRRQCAYLGLEVSYQYYNYKHNK